MYELIYSRRALKELKKLAKEDNERIIASLERVRIRPEAHLLKMVGSPLYRLKVGQYRAIIKMENDKLLIIVIKIGHRKNVYDKL